MPDDDNFADQSCGNREEGLQESSVLGCVGRGQPGSFVWSAGVFGIFCEKIEKNREDISD